MEQVSLNQRVPGSSPGAPTNHSKHLAKPKREQTATCDTVRQIFVARRATFDSLGDMVHGLFYLRLRQESRTEMLMFGKKDDPQKREKAAEDLLTEAAKELARINNEKPMTKEQAEEISRRST